MHFHHLHKPQNPPNKTPIFNLRNHPHYNRRLQPRLLKQEIETRALLPSQSCGGWGPNNTNQIVAHPHNLYRSRHQTRILPTLRRHGDHITYWQMGCHKVLIDNGSQTEIMFLSAFDQMGFNRKQLKDVSKPLYGFGSKRIEPVGSISLPVSFGNLPIPARNI
jgi:hypothetical protein